MTPRTGRLLLASAIAAGAALRLRGIAFGLPLALARPDEEKVIGAAIGIAHGDLNPHLFLYPTLFMYAMGAVYKLLLVASSAPLGVRALHLVPRLLAAAAGVATIPALYGAASEVFSKRTALVAAILLSFAFLHVRDSHFGTTDVPVTFLIVCAFWAGLRCATQGVTSTRVAVTGVLCGLAASTKYNAAIVALPAATAIAADAWHARRIGRAIVPGALLGVCLVGAFFAGTPYALLDRPAFIKELRQQSLTAAGRRGGTILTPAYRIVAERGWRHHFTFSLPYGLGIPLFAAALAGLVALAAEASLRSALVLSFPLAFYLVMGFSELVYPRWIVPLVPFLCLTAAYAIDRASAALPRAAVVAFALVAIAAAPTAARAVAFDEVISQTDTRVLGSKWIEVHFPSGATVYQSGVFYGFLEPQPADRYQPYGFDEDRDAFTISHHRVDTMPDVIVVLRSPLVIFSGVPDAIQGIVAKDYQLAQTFSATRADRPFDAVYDQQDAFYVPLAGMDSVRRPGPDVEIYARR